ncbi:class I SAM-dependent methyltransferase [Paraburkholderia sp. BR10923]|uniref:class I SAM-dependent methyltransferase n=1 Tax=Paraburkholderia sp. BR10923 TaxID=3236992 RepID=UPI0034CD19BA
MTHDNIGIAKGAYADEWDAAADAPFCWLSRQVTLEVNGTGMLVIEGECPVPQGTVRITTPQSAYTVPLAGGHQAIQVPLAHSPDAHRVTLEFGAAADVPADTRELCFKARNIHLRDCAASTTAATNAGLVADRGLLEGNVSVTFANGWLRLNARKTAAGRLHVSGILVPPLHAQTGLELVVNRRPVSGMTYGLFNPDYAFLGNVAFEGEIDLAPYRGQRELRIGSIVSAQSEPATPWHQDWIYPLDPPNLPVPGSENMRRIGSGEVEWFLLSGATFIGKLDEVLSRYGSAPPSTFDVLDWGCGCGRLTRHLLSRGFNVVGIDIDETNIAWCRENLPAGDFRLVSPDLPTSLPSECFDLVVGHSIFTHLAELDQFLWLCEINRVLKPGGLAVVTVMANFSAAIDLFTPHAFHKLSADGFLDVGWQQDGVDTQRPGYYRRIFHTIDYVRRRWSSFLDIAAILEGYSDHQAAIVLRKRP